MKYYAVRVGRVPGIYTNWNTTSAQVTGFPGAVHKKFDTLQEAEIFMQGGEITPSIPTPHVEKPITPPRIPTHIPTTETIIYTDGSSKKSVGGYGFVVLRHDQEPQGYAGKLLTYPATNQQAELTAILMALRTVRDPNILIRTDSKYSIGCLTEWYQRWEQNGWRTAHGPVENKNLIQEVLAEIRSKPVRSIRFEYVKAHASDVYNIEADRLADQGRQM